MPRSFRRGHKRGAAGDRRGGLRRALIITVALLVETVPTWVRTHRIAGNFIVRCRKGHLFTTIWIPGASVKALRLGLWRFQRCPVGHHWSLVTAVKESELSESERRAAHENRDIRLI